MLRSLVRTLSADDYLERSRGESKGAVAGVGFTNSRVSRRSGVEWVVPKKVPVTGTMRIAPEVRTTFKVPE